MKVKEFCSKCANWYAVEIIEVDGILLFEGTTLEACYSKYADNEIIQFILNGYEGLKNNISIYIEA